MAVCAISIHVDLKWFGSGSDPEFDVPREPRLHLVAPAHGPRPNPRLPKGARQAAQEAPMETMPKNGTITHAAIPNPNFVEGRELPRYAAIRFASCVSPDEASGLLEQVQALKDAKMQFHTFLQAWIGLWREYPSSLPGSSKTSRRLARASRP
ncbi:hypothetical protein Alg130_10102 [Pyrenophora tritici-repentis]|nr:hypothetical protein Alg130_10102 [Pyrenophora tritici-repentis]